jgi:uncharacterized protein YggT (Ycf19 family)
MGHTVYAWLMAGSPAHWMCLLASLWVGASFILSKFPQVKANTTAELLFNVVNPKVLPILEVIPVIGPLLAAILKSLDSPESGAAKMSLPPAAMLLPIVLIGLTGCAFCKLPANYNAAQCKAERVLLNCGASEVVALLNDVMPQVEAALVSSDYENLMSNIEQQLGKEGVVDAPSLLTCAVNQIASKVMPKASQTTSSVHLDIKAHAEAWKAKHGKPVKAAK